MRRVPSLTFSLDADASNQKRGPSPARLAPLVGDSLTLADYLSGLPEKAELGEALLALATGAINISALMRHGLRSPTSFDCDRRAGDVERMDMRAALLMVDAVRDSLHVVTVALETELDVIPLGPRGDEPRKRGPPVITAAADRPQFGIRMMPDAVPQSVCRTRYAMVIDPLNGASDADAGASVGTIFSIFAVDDDSPAGEAAHVLRPGREIVAAGYALYGAATQLVLSVGNGVHGFTLDPDRGVFQLTRPNLLMPFKGRYFSVNQGHARGWSHTSRKYVQDLAKRRSQRYIGSYVADLHRTLLYGGLFFYPES